MISRSSDRHLTVVFSVTVEQPAARIGTWRQAGRVRLRRSLNIRRATVVRRRQRRSRGGLTTKVHLACEQRQKPLSMVITAGQRGDSLQFQVVLGQIRVPRPGGGRARTRPDRVLAD
jgi:hypothetical protein